MKRLVLMLCICAFSLQAQRRAPHYIIYPQIIKLKYKEYQYTDTLIIPVISDDYLLLKKAVAEKIFDGEKLEDVVKNYEEDGHGYTGVSYEIAYSDAHVISFIFSYETMGAYPDSYQKFLTYNIYTGKPYRLTDEINKAGITALFAQYRRFLKDGLAEIKNDIKKDSGVSDAEAAQIIATLKTSIDKLKPADVFNNYVFNKKGIKLTSNGVLPHAIRNYELARDWLITYDELKPYKAATAIVLK